MKRSLRIFYQLAYFKSQAFRRGDTEAYPSSMEDVNQKALPEIQSLSADQQKQLTLLRGEYEPYSGYYQKPFWENRPNKVRIGEIEDKTIQAFYLALGFPEESEWDIDSVVEQIETIRSTLTRNDVVGLELYDPVPKGISELNGVLQRSLGAFSACAGTMVAGGACSAASAFGFAPKWVGYSAAAAGLLAFPITAAYTRGLLDPVLPKGLRLGKVDPEKIFALEERDQTMAKRADAALRMRAPKKDELLLIAGKLHMPGITRNLIEKGYREMSLSEVESSMQTVAAD